MAICISVPENSYPGECPRGDTWARSLYGPQAPLRDFYFGRKVMSKETVSLEDFLHIAVEPINGFAGILLNSPDGDQASVDVLQALMVAAKDQIHKIADALEKHAGGDIRLCVIRDSRTLFASEITGVEVARRHAA